MIKSRRITAVTTATATSILRKMSSSTPNSNSLSPFAAKRLSKLNQGGTVFSKYTALANEHKAVNLGQGFPTLPVAPFILQAAAKAIAHPDLGHQYTRSEGHPRLVKALASFYTPKLALGRDIDPMREVMTTVGASEAIYSTIQALIDEGDEVILMQPYYDSYPASVLLAGGKPVIVSLKSNASSASQTSQAWKLDFNELEAAITSRTKLLIVNNPNNPLGKVWSREELESLAKIAEKHNLIVLADEVYETLVYSDSASPMIKFASIPGMWERTVTVGSMGKMFGVTGWKIGWIIAPANLTRSAWMVHQFLPFCVVAPLQEAGADALEQAMFNTYFEATTKLYQDLRDKLMGVLEEAGLRPMLPEGGYFIIAKVDPKTSQGEDYSTFLTTKIGVTPIPMSAFYDQASVGDVEHYIRFAFCKDEKTLEEAGKRLLKGLH